MIRPVIIGNGSSSIKLGYGGDDEPSCTIPSIVSQTKHYNCYSNVHKNNNQSVLVGDLAQNSKELASLIYPIKNGVVIDWDSLEKLWARSFELLAIVPTEIPVLV